MLGKVYKFYNGTVMTFYKKENNNLRAIINVSNKEEQVGKSTIINLKSINKFGGQRINFDHDRSVKVWNNSYLAERDKVLGRIFCSLNMAEYFCVISIRADLAKAIIVEADKLISDYKIGDIIEVNLNRRNHNYETHDNCEKTNCLICDGGLSICEVCGLAEGELTTDCPGEKVSWDKKEFLMSGELDYRLCEGGWVEKSNYEGNKYGNAYNVLRATKILQSNGISFYDLEIIFKEASRYQWAIECEKNTLETDLIRACKDLHSYYENYGKEEYRKLINRCNRYYLTV